MKKPITQAAVREMRRTIKRLGTENRDLRNSNSSLRRSFFSDNGASDEKWVSALVDVNDTTVAAVRTAKRLGFGVAVRLHSTENRLDFYAIPTEVPRNV